MCGDTEGPRERDSSPELKLGGGKDEGTCPSLRPCGPETRDLPIQGCLKNFRGLPVRPKCESITGVASIVTGHVQSVGC